MQNIVETGFMSGDKLLYYDFGEYRLDVLNGELLNNGKPIKLKPKSLEILVFFIRNRGRLLKKKELLNTFWTDTFVDESNLAQHIYLLRKVLHQNSSDDFQIKTIPKSGYRFIGQVAEIFQADAPEAVFAKADRKIVFEFDSSPLLESSENSNSGIQNTNEVYWKIGAFGAALVFVVSIYLYSSQYFAPNSQPSLGSQSIAVLPFRQINAEDQENIGLGMADVIISQLGKLETVQIIPTSSIVQYGGNNDSDLFEVGRKLKVDLILVGTIHRQGEEVRITYQVFSVKDKHPIISDKIDGKFTNVFTLQDTVSEQILQRISLNLNPNQSLLIMSYICPTLH